MDEVAVFFTFVGVSSLVGFVVGFFYGIDRANERTGNRLRAAEAEAKECRQMALNFGSVIEELIREKNERELTQENHI